MSQQTDYTAGIDPAEIREALGIQSDRHDGFIHSLIVSAVLAEGDGDPERIKLKTCRMAMNCSDLLAASTIGYEAPFDAERFSDLIPTPIAVAAE